MTVITFPLALSPYRNILLYTPKCSRTLTIASGVHGSTDLTVPSGPSSESFDFGGGDGRLASGIGLRVTGEMNRTLRLLVAEPSNRRTKGREIREPENQRSPKDLEVLGGRGDVLVV